MKYLLTTTEVYRVGSEEEATKLIAEAKKESGYILSKYSSQYKEKKSKGEVIDYYWKVTLVKEFNNEKEPMTNVEITYTEGSAF
jgi:hypothetical protein